MEIFFDLGVILVVKQDDRDPFPKHMVLPHLKL